MSGGVDSSTVCMMLLEQGYEIEGVTMRMWDTPKNFKKFNNELPDYIIEAKNLAQRLNFRHHIIDARSEFKIHVINNFINAYMTGKTPNPCVECNKYIKWPTSFYIWILRCTWYYYTHNPSLHHLLLPFYYSKTTSIY